MKKSYYNFVFPGEEGTRILYNSRTGAMAELDESHAEQLENLSEEELLEKNPEFAYALLENGFAVEDGVSELDMIRYDMLRTRYGNKSLVLTITPTLDCNFGCKYCYEKEVVKNQYMDEETQEAVLEYILKNVTPEGNLHINWYGGEPLMALDKIKYMTEEILKICKEKKVLYSAEIITNGYLLNKETAEDLINCRITKIQITLDGSEKTHNQRRPLVTGEGTYHTIWNNILMMKEYRDKIRIALRVNVDKNNSDALYEIEKQLAFYELTDYIYLYPGKVMAVGKCYCRNDCYNNYEFAQLEQVFTCSYEEKTRNSYPSPKHIVCGADNNNAMVIAANGDLYKCWLDIGNAKRCIGNVKNTEIRNESLLYEYLLHDATQDKNCKQCKYLPICLGGCCNRRTEGEESCTLYKYSLKQYMNYLPHIMK